MPLITLCYYFDPSLTKINYKGNSVYKSTRTTKGLNRIFLKEF